MKHLVLIALLGTPVFAENEIHKQCLKDHSYAGLDEINHWSNIATCVDKAKNKVRRKEEDRLWEFVKANPEYRFPGQSLNKCFAKPEEIAIKRVEHTSDGMIVYYKESINPCIKRNM